MEGFDPQGSENPKIGPIFVQNTKNAPINCRYSEPFFHFSRGTPGVVKKMAEKWSFFGTFGRSRKTPNFGVLLPIFRAKMARF